MYRAPTDFRGTGPAEDEVHWEIRVYLEDEVKKEQFNLFFNFRFYLINYLIVTILNYTLCKFLF